MITLIIKLLISFPKIGAMVLKIRQEYVKELSNRRHNKHSNTIDEWVRKSDDEQNP